MGEAAVLAIVLLLAGVAALSMRERRPSRGGKRGELSGPGRREWS